MAILYVTEFADLANSQGRVGQVTAQPYNTQQTVAISSTSATSAAFMTNTRFVRLHTDAICSVAFGTAPVASATGARMAANQTEYYSVPGGASYKVAVISNT